MIQLSVLGPAWILANVTVTVNRVSCAYSGDVLSTRPTATAARRIIFIPSCRRRRSTLDDACVIEAPRHSPKSATNTGASHSNSNDVLEPGVAITHRR